MMPVNILAIKAFTLLFLVTLGSIKICFWQITKKLPRFKTCSSAFPYGDNYQWSHNNHLYHWELVNHNNNSLQGIAFTLLWGIFFLEGIFSFGIFRFLGR